MKILIELDEKRFKEWFQTRKDELFLDLPLYKRVHDPECKHQTPPFEPCFLTVIVPVNNDYSEIIKILEIKS